MPSKSPRGWHSRGYLTHLDAPGEIQFLTFRLADCLPAKVIESWKHDLPNLPETQAKMTLYQKIATFEDAGHGSCLLKEPQYASLVENALLHFDDHRYRLLEWVIMPNHIHVLIQPLTERLDQIITSWKSFTARRINEAAGTTGPVWARDYYDRYIRDQEHYESTRAYIRDNPVKAKLCKRPEDWEFSSASWELRE